MNGNGRVKGVVVDAGHGGADPGAVGNGLQEKNLNLEASRYMYNRLRELGIPAVMTRSDDRTLTRDERVSTMVNSFGNTPDVLVLANHINAGGGEGAEVYYPLRSDGVLARQILEGIGAQGQRMRGTFQRTLPEDPSKDYYYIMRLTPNTTALLIEYGYIDNAQDAAKLRSNLLNYVEGVVRAVANYAGVPYTPPSGSSNNIYTVQRGDSLWSIANRFNTTVDNLRRWNNLTSDILQIGQRLLVSNTPNQDDNPQGYQVYTVKRDDSLYKIANQFGVTVASLMELNDLSSSQIYIGQQLFIPGTATNTPSPSGYYTVQRNDSLWSIAQRFGTTVNALRQANNLTSDMLQIGQQLIIPNANTGAQRTYTVQRNDSLWSIAQQFGTTVNALRQANNLTSDTLQIGQVLRIPTSTPASVTSTYSNDSWY